MEVAILVMKEMLSTEWSDAAKLADARMCE